MTGVLPVTSGSFGPVTGRLFCSRGTRATGEAGAGAGDGGGRSAAEGSPELMGVVEERRGLGDLGERGVDPAT